MRFLRFTLAVLLAASCCVAQTPQTADGGASGMTLHVTVKELQVAALVLDVHRRPVQNLDKSRFRLQLDTSKPFAPFMVHREGDDPLSLAIVLDMSQERKYNDRLADALAGLRERALLPHDHLFLYAVDCGLITYKGDASTPESVKQGVADMLDNAKLHYHGSKSKTCAGELRLWDVSMLALRRLSTAPGRRVLLLMTEGKDTASVTPMQDVARYSALTATTLFALPGYDMQSPVGPKSQLEYLTIKTGGQLLDSPSKNNIEQSFLDCLSMLRERYVLGFNQPRNARAGEHVIQAQVQHSDYTIRTSGVTAPMSEKDGVTSTDGQDASSDVPSAKP